MKNAAAIRDHAIGAAALLAVMCTIGYIRLKPSVTREAAAASLAMDIDTLNREISRKSGELNRQTAATGALHTELQSRGAGLGSGDENVRMKELNEFAESFGLANIAKNAGERTDRDGFVRTQMTTQFDGTFVGIARFMTELENRFADFDVESFTIRRSGSEKAILEMRMVWITRATSG